MSDEPKKRRWWGWIGWVLVLMFLLYPLSMGPAWWACNHVEPIWVVQTYVTVYAPLRWTARHNEMFSNVLTSYLFLWVPPPRSHFGRR